MKLRVADSIKQWWATFEQYSHECWIFSLVWLVLISWSAFIWHLGSIGLVDETEPLFAEAARQMAVTGDWITPYFNGETRFDKPPLIYWLMAVGYKLLGVNEWAVRLPSVLAAIALVGFCFYTLRYFGFATVRHFASLHSIPQKLAKRQLWLSAWIGSALAAFNIQTLIWARTGVSDMLLSSCIGGAILCFFWGYVSKSEADFLRPPSRRSAGHRFRELRRLRAFRTSLRPPSNGWYWAFYVLLALAVLTKGPVGVVLPGLVIIAFLLYVGKFWEVLQEMGIVVGGLLFVVIALPWFVLVIAEHGSAYTDTFFGYHNFERFTEVVNGHSAPWYYYFLIVLGLFAPWSVYLPVAIARLRFWQLSRWRSQPRSSHLGLLALFWFVGIFVFFTVAVTKLPSYVLPLIPAAAILVALLWSEELSSVTYSKKLRWGLLISGMFNVLLLLILAAACFYSPQLMGSDPAIKNETELLQASGLPLLGGIIWLTTALVSAGLLTVRYWRRWLVLPNLIGFVAFVSFVLTPVSSLADQVRQLPLRQIANIIPQVQQPGEEIWMVGLNKPSLVFYTEGNPINFFKTNGQLKEYLEETDTARFPATVLLISPPNKLRSFELESQDYQKLAVKGAYQVTRIAPQTLLESDF